MKKLWLLGLIILLAAFLRLYKLDQNPPALYWDEASLGYNAFSILTTGHDEHGEFLPQTRFIAFGDYKPPGYIYAAVPALAVFGVNEFAIRFPSATAGIILVILTYLLTKEITKNHKIALLASLLLAISPWDLQLSRAAFEAHLAAACIAGGVLLFLWSRKKPQLMPLAAIAFIAAFYTFNANRIVTPLIAGLVFLLYIKDYLVNKRWILVTLIFSVILMWPNISYFQTRESRLRFDEVSIFTNLDIVKTANERIERSGNSWWAKILFNRRVFFAQSFMSHYIDHFKGKYLFISGDGNPRLSVQDVGEMYLFEIPLVFFGLYQLLRRPSKVTAVILGWLLIAPIPAAMARETPHMLRTASTLPTFQIIGGIGGISLLTWLRHRKSWLRWTSLSFYCVVVVFCVFYYLHNYWVHYPRTWSGEWQYGYKQMVEKVNTLSTNYDVVKVTSALGRPYIYFLLFNKVSPLTYASQRRADRDWYGFWEVSRFEKYDFSSDPVPEGKRILKVGGKDTFVSHGKKLAEIRDPMGKIVFEIGEP